ncbi:MAG: hypothetical protein FDZ75_03330, partial [Actinobacteria bacterium]
MADRTDIGASRPSGSQAVTDLGDVVSRVRENASHLHAEYGVTKIGVFGSFAEARQRSDSDVDFLVAFEGGDGDTD